ncbi:MAG: hypothetical protein WCO45_12860 [Pseudanabaena sp. ELA607]|jgi:hypothetical protein
MKFSFDKLAFSKINHHHLAIFTLIFSGYNLSLNNLALAANPNTEKHVYPEEVQKTYLRGCQYTNPPSFCQCTIDKFQNKYSFQTFRQLENQYIETKKIPAEVLEIFIDCQKKVNPK